MSHLQFSSKRIFYC